MTGQSSRHTPQLQALAAALAAVFSLVRPHAAESAIVGSMPASLGAAATRDPGGALGKLMLPRNAVRAAVGVRPKVVASSSVTNCADDGGSDTLRFAVQTANNGDTIKLSGLPCSKITLAAEIEVDLDDLTIEGPGADKLTIDGGGVDRVFLHTGKGTFGLTDVTIANGKVEVDKAIGGCVYSKNNIALTRATVSSCQAIGQSQALGGGVVAYNELTAESSTISNNLVDATVGAVKTVVSAGGGVFANKLTLVHSTVSGNTAHAALGSCEGAGAIGYTVTAKYSTLTGNHAVAIGNTDNYAVGGGVIAIGSMFMLSSTVDHNDADIAGGAFVAGSASGFATVIQTTISSNKGRLSIGGIASAATLSMGNSTVAFNTGGPFGGGGVVASGATATLQSTIMADNTPSDLDGYAAFSGTSNIIKIAGPNVSALPSMTSSLDPQLGPLAFNGGTTRTHAPGAGSPAIDGGTNPANLTVDQRGPTYVRVSGAAPDIGAVEVDFDHIFGDPFGG